jgi:acyl-coenzyme A synthetase/AMP-(fatty) acid ligase
MLAPHDLGRPGALREELVPRVLSGRIDNVLNVSRHRSGTMEIESALVQHELVEQAAVVGWPTISPERLSAPSWC